MPTQEEVDKHLNYLDGFCPVFDYEGTLSAHITEKFDIPFDKAEKFVQFWCKNKSTSDTNNINITVMKI